MNKKTLRIAGWALGLSMAVAGIGAVSGIAPSNLLEVKATSQTVTTTINDVVSSNSYSVSSGSSVGDIVTSIALNADISVSTTGSANSGSFWGDSTRDWRLYQNTDATFTITAKSPCKITGFQVAYGTDKGGILATSAGTSKTAAFTSNQKVTGLNTSSVTYYVANSGTKTNGQVRITSISVTYDDGAVPATGISLSSTNYTPVGKNVTIDKGAGEGAVEDTLIATLSPANATNAIDWSVTGDEIYDFDNGYVLIDTSSEGSFTVTVTAHGTLFTDYLTYYIVDPDAAVLDHVSVAGTLSTSTQYAGNEFNAAGLTFKAVYDDDTEIAISAGDIDWDTLVVGNKATGTYTNAAGTEVDVEVSLVVLENTLTITMGGSMVKTTYAQSDSWDPSGLTKSGSYADGTSYAGEITWSYSPETPAGLTVGEGRSVRVTATSETGESTYEDIEVNITEPVYEQTNGIGAGGTFYILNDDRSYGISALNDDPSNAIPGIQMSTVNNTLIPFTLTLVGDYTYEITATINEKTCYIVNNSTATSSANNNLRLIQKSEAAGTITQYGWKINELVADSGNYTAAQNTTGSTWRYITEYIANHDFRGYIKAYVGEDITTDQDSVLHFVPEKDYALTVANALLNDLACDNGVTAPSTSVWSSISTSFSNTKIAHERAFLTNGVADKDSSDPVERALAKYDYIVGKYLKGKGIAAYNDFLGRDPSIPAAGAFNLGPATDNGTDVSMLAAVITILSAGALAAGGLFLARKRRSEEE